MSHFAKVEDNIVTQVIVAEQDFIDTLSGTWVQTSYNTKHGQHPNGTPLRKNFAGIGYTYDSTKDAFIPPQKHPTWVLNETTCMWEAPVAKPDDGELYQWNRDTNNWSKLPPV